MESQISYINYKEDKLMYITDSIQYTIRNTQNSMSFYEKWSLIIAGAALILSICIPIFQYLYHKYKKTKLSIVPFESTPLILMFNESGCYFKLKFCIQCEHQDATISTIHATITRKSDNFEREYEWSTLESIYLNWLGNNTSNNINSVSYARPYKLKADTLEPFIVEFSNENDSKELESIVYDNLTSLNQFIRYKPDYDFKTATDIESFNKLFTKIRNDFKKDLSFKTTYKAFEEHFYWEPDTYYLNLYLYYDTGNLKTFRFEFIISEDDSKKLLQNYDSIIFGKFEKQYNLPPRCIPLFKDLKEID